MSRETDYEKALLSPASVFARPEDVLMQAGLTQQQRIEILRRWEYDESEVAVAVEEGMPGEESTLLRRILIALEQLPGGVDWSIRVPRSSTGSPASTRKGGRRNRRPRARLTPATHP